MTGREGWLWTVGVLFGTNMLVTAFGGLGPHGRPRQWLQVASGIGLASFVFYVVGWIVYLSLGAILNARNPGDVVMGIIVLAIVAVMVVAHLPDRAKIERDAAVSASRKADAERVLAYEERKRGETV